MKHFFTLLLFTIFTFSANAQFNCNDAIELWCGETISDNNITNCYNTVTQGYCGSTYDGYTGREKLYKFTVTGSTKTVKILLANLTADLDMFLLRSCSPGDCIAKSDKSSSYNYEFISVTLSPGEYYIVIDGWGGAASNYNLQLSCTGNSGQLECIDAPEISCGESISSNTNTGVNNTDGLYCNAHGNYSGKEKIYELNLDVTSEVTIKATGLQADLDMFLLNACERQKCVALSGNGSSNSEIIKKVLEPGQYFIILDGYQGVSSPFNLSVSCNDINTLACEDLVTSYYSGNGANLKFNYKFNAQPNTQFVSWKVNGSTLATAPHVQFIFPSAGNYNICAVYRNLLTGQLETCCRTACITIPTSCEDIISYQYVNGIYKLTMNTNMANVSNVSWRNDTDGVNIDPNNMPASCRTLTVTVRYFDLSSNCWVLCCRTITFCPPSSCENAISSSYDAQTNQYTFDFSHASASNLIWKFDETGEVLTDGKYTLPSGWTCADRTATVYYYDTVLKSWKVCCKKFNLCPPASCEGTIDYDYIASGNKFKFTLNVTGATNAEWEFEEDGTVLPNGVFQLPTNWTCKDRTVKVTYYDPSMQVYRVCTKRFSICPPDSCSQAITSVYDAGTKTFTFNLDIDGATDLHWRFDEDNIYLPNGQFTLPIGWECREYTVSVFYYDASSNCYRVCCKKVDICPPSSCNDNQPSSSFDFAVSGSLVSFTNTSSNFDSISWDYDGGTANSFGDVSYTPGTYNVCLQVFNECGEDTSCEEVVISDPQTASNLTFTVDEIDCRGEGTEVIIPVTAKNFENILSFNFTIAATDSTDVKMLGIEVVNPLFVSGSNSVVMADHLRFFWASTAGQNLDDDAIIFNIRIALINETAAPVLLQFVDDPVMIEAFNGNLNRVTVDTDDGSLCVSAPGALANIGGKVIMPGDGAPINKVKMIILGTENKEMTTEEDGEFMFEGLTNGGNYIVKPSKVSNPYNGLNALDIVALQRHILQISPLSSPYKWIAADVNNDTAINGLDVVVLQRMILRILDEFPNNSSWRFIPEDYSFTTDDPLNEDFPEELMFNNISGDYMSENFMGIKIGDLNASADLLRSGGAGDTLAMKMNSVYVEEDSQVEIEVRVAGFSELSAVEGSLEWNTEDLEFVEVRDFGVSSLAAENFGRPFDTDNKLTFSWFEASIAGETIADSTILFKLVFQTKGEVGVESKIKFVDEPLSVFAADKNLEAVFVAERDGSVAFIEPLSAEAAIEDVLCKSGNDGSISLAVQGATGNYKYEWENGSTSSEISGLEEGNYSYTITDIFSDSKLTASMEVRSPDQLVVTLVDNSSDGDSLSTVSVEVIGGVEPYDYTWSSPAISGGEVSELADGVYDVTVSDANDCEVRGSIEVNREMSSSIPEIEIGSISVFPNPTVDKINVRLSDVGSSEDSSWSIFNTLGQLVKSGEVEKGDLEFSINLTEQATGLYYLKMNGHSVPILRIK